MKLKFVNGDVKREEVQETPLSLKIRDDGSASLMCAQWFLLRLNTDGTVLREPSFPKDLGFKLDEQGRIQLSEEEA